MVDGAESFVAECFWPDVKEADLVALDRRVAAATAELNRPRRPIRYLGSILLREDEVVLCQFEGTAETVREAAERARVPFERILAADRSRCAIASDTPTGSDQLSEDPEVRNDS